jgi:ribonuclease P protein component
MNNTFKKSERLTSQILIDKLFAGGNASMAAFPLRVVYMQMEKAEGSRIMGSGEDAEGLDAPEEYPPVSVLVSVPKKRFRHAVDRNRMKRLVREAYRLNKHILWDALSDRDMRLVLAFVCITDTLPSFRAVNKSVVKALNRIVERMEGLTV